MTDPPSNAPDLLNELVALPREERVARVRAAGPADEVVLELVEAATRLASAEAQRALDATDAVLGIADDLAVPVARARARRARARALAYTGRFEEALAACFDAVDIATRADEPIEAGRARLTSMHALGELGRLDEAIAAGSAAREQFLSADAPEFAARADINLGIVHQRRDEPAEALACFARARPLLIDEPLSLGYLDNSRGEALKEINDFAGAEEAYLAALHAFEEADSAVTSAIAEGNLADLAVREGRLQRALYYFEGARRHLEQAQAPTHVARLVAEQAEARALLGLPRDALREYDQALVELDRCGLALEAARARHGMGLVLLRLERPAEAETSLAAAATAFDELGHKTARAKVDLARADVALRHGRAAEARGMATRALSSLHDRPADAAAARHLLARIFLAMGESEQASAELDAARAAARTLDLAPLLADILETRGTVRRRTGDLDGAVSDLAESVGHIERLRGSLQADRFRTAFLGDRAATHEALVATRLERGGTDDAMGAFAAAEQAKSRSLLDHVRGELDLDDITASPPVDAAEATMREDLVRVRSELNALYSRLADDKHTGAGNWRDVVRAHEQELADVESRLAATRRGNWIYGASLAAADVQAVLGADHVLLEYFIAENTVVVFAISAGGIEARRLSVTAGDLEQRLARLQFQIDRALRPGVARERRSGRLLDETRRDLAELDALLLAPVRDAIAGARRITVVPHGPLHLVPFHALHDGERYLVETTEVNVAPSASLFAHLERGERDPHRDVAPLVIGVADEIAPQIENEARLVGRLLGCDDAAVLTGDAATADRVADAVPAASLIHLACHGRFDPDSPFASGVRLADRWLTIREIAALRLDADLVTLSGCETGLNLVHAGDELVGLLGSFFRAGAASMLVSLWRVHDECTARFMSAFYDSVDSGRNHAAVLREAQLALLAADPHPAFWAPFVLVGRS
ncbi:MAG: CHAT domain-containing protein [Planctomycetota bacterium]|jgi:CHAT domain-containing protein